MRKLIFLLSTFLSVNAFAQNDSVMIKRIFSDALMNGRAYENLRELTKNIGARLSGSPSAAKAVEWAKKKMIEAGADTVYLEPVMVPQWIRGKKETASIIEQNGNKTPVSVCALGNSVATPKEGVTAQVIEVNEAAELKKFAPDGLKGKIVFFNHPFDESLIGPFEAYGEAVWFRWAGPSEASRYGAIGTVCRSMTSAFDDIPHTGGMRYNDSLPKIPCCAISTMTADLLSRIIKANKNTRFTFTQECHFSDSVLSYNVIGEIRGTTSPEKIVVVGGHLDSWDLGEGAHDDGAGVVQSIEILRLFKANNIRPKATLRIIAFMNEENGLRGGRTYAANVKAKNEKHVAAIESDGGGFAPTGFGLQMTDEERAKIRAWAPLFLPYGIYNFPDEGDGADIGPLETMKVPCIGLYVMPQRYFDYHHTVNDTFDKVNRRELHLGAAAMASLAWLLCNYMPVGN
jgi:carboxypeptidase Q